MNSDQDCPPVSGYVIYEDDCKTLSGVFKNPRDLIQTLSNGMLYAHLVDGAKI